MTAGCGCSFCSRDLHACELRSTNLDNLYPLPTKFEHIVALPYSFVKQNSRADPLHNPSSYRSHVPAYLAIGLAILAVSTASIFIRYAQRSAPSLVIAAWRLALATVILAPVALSNHRAEMRAFQKRQAALAVLSGLFLAVHFGSWITSLQYTSVASSVVLVTTTPLWVGLFSPLVLHESIDRRVAIGLVVALVGSIVIGLSDTCQVSTAGVACPPLSDFTRGSAFIGDVLALLGAWMAAGYLMIGRRLRANTSLVAYTFVVYGVSALILILAAGGAGQKLMGYPWIVYLWFLALAVIPQLFGHTTFNWALKYVSAAYVSVALLGEPVGSTILAYLLLGEKPGSVKIAGMVMTLAGIYLASRVQHMVEPTE
jgi:drug/metabolite transporter (DMT)-like permease